MNQYRDYWQQTYEDFSKQDPSGQSRLRVVCYQAWPLIFNQVMDFFERYTARRMIEKFSSDFKGKTVLDVGCGTGRWCQFFEKYQSRIVGTDLFEKLLADNQKYFPGVSFCAMNASQLALKDRSIDFVSAGIVLQHVPKNQKTLAVSEIARVLRPGGLAFILESVAGNGYKEGKTASLLRFEEWEKMLGTCGLSILRQKPLHAYPLAVLYKRIANGIGGLIKKIKSIKRKKEAPEIFAGSAEGQNKTPRLEGKRHIFYRILDQTFLKIIACLSFPLEFLWLFFGWNATHRMFLVKKKEGVTANS